MNRKLSAAIVLALASGVTAAHAASPADTNGDGALSFEEMQAVNPQASQDRFDALDGDGNGLLSRDELFAGGPGGNGGPPWRRIDSNDDGMVSFEELQAAFPDVAQARFDNLDENGDGVLSGAELQAGRQRGRDRDRPEIDTDGDGNISLAELQAVRGNVSTERFIELDANGDGLLSRDELPRPGDRLRALDTDDSGGISLPEIQARRPEFDQERFGRLDRDGNGELGAGEMRPRRFEGMRRDGPGEFGGRPPIAGGQRSGAAPGGKPVPGGRSR